MKPSVVTLDYALSDWILNTYPHAVINGETIAKQIFFFYREKMFDGRKIARISSSEPQMRVYSKYISTLTAAGVIAEIDGFHSPASSYYPFYGSYEIKSKAECTPEEAACVIYPHAFVSYLSAMDFHGFTDKNPIQINLSAPPKDTWKNLSLAALDDIILEEASEFSKGSFIPRYPRETNLLGKPLKVYSEVNNSSVIEARSSSLRVTSVSRTLVDMLRKPENCGGVDHAFEAYIENAHTHRRSLLKYIDEFGSSIDKARNGFILKKVLGISDPKLDAWSSEERKKRGGSRVFVSGDPFSSYYDPDWGISLNYKPFEKYGIKND